MFFSLILQKEQCTTENNKAYYTLPETKTQCHKTLLLYTYTPT